MAPRAFSEARWRTRKFVTVDASKAKALPGVIATLTRDDIQGFNYKYGATYKDQSIVAADKVRYVGDPVAAVLADDPATAEAALELIEVEYEELPKVTNIEEATAPGAALVHEPALPGRSCAVRSTEPPEDSTARTFAIIFELSARRVAKGFARRSNFSKTLSAFKKYSIIPSKRTTTSLTTTARS